MATLLWLKAEIWGHVVAGNRGADSGNRKADSLDGALYMSPDFSGAARNVLCRMQKLGITRGFGPARGLCGDQGDILLVKEYGDESEREY